MSLKLFERGDEGIAIGRHVRVGFFRVGRECLALEYGDDVGDKKRWKVDGGGLVDEVDEDGKGDAGNFLFEGGAED